jgi:hypothetical protein
MDEIYHKDTIFHIETKCDHITKTIFLDGSLHYGRIKCSWLRICTHVMSNMCNILQWIKLCSSIKATTDHKYVTIDIHHWVSSRESPLFTITYQCGLTWFGNRGSTIFVLPKLVIMRIVLQQETCKFAHLHKFSYVTNVWYSNRFVAMVQQLPTNVVEQQTNQNLSFLTFPKIKAQCMH